MNFLFIWSFSWKHVAIIKKLCKFQKRKSLKFELNCLYMSKSLGQGYTFHARHTFLCLAKIICWANILCPKVFWVWEGHGKSIYVY